MKPPPPWKFPAYAGGSTDISVKPNKSMSSYTPYLLSGQVPIAVYATAGQFATC